MGKQASLVENELRHCRQVFERALETLLSQERSGLWEYRLRLITKAEQSLFASRTTPGFSHRENFLRCHKWLAIGRRVRSERTIAAIVATQMRQRDENFLRVANRTAF